MLFIQGNARNIICVDFGADKTWDEVATITTAAQTATIPGLKSTDKIISVSKPTEQAGLGVGNAFVSADDTISVQFINPTAAGITPTALETWTAFILRPENTRTDASA